MNESIIRNATTSDIEKVYDNFNQEQALWAVKRLIELDLKKDQEIERLNSEVDSQSCLEDELYDKDCEIEGLKEKIENIKEILEA